MQGLHFGDTEITGLYFGDTEIWAAWSEYDGTLPAQYTANGSVLADYRVYGAAGGVGDVTENLFDKNAKDPDNGYLDNAYIRQSDGATITSTDYYLSEYIEVEPNETYTWVFSFRSTVSLHTAPTVEFLDALKNRISVASHSSQIRRFSFTTPADCTFIRASVYKLTSSNSSLALGSPASYIPFGYEVPMSVQSANEFDYTQGANWSSLSIGTANQRIPASAGDVKTVGATTQLIPRIVFLGTSGRIAASVWAVGGVVTATAPGGTISCAVEFRNSAYNLITEEQKATIFECMLNSGDTLLPFQPYSNTVTPIYIGDDPLEADEYVDFEEQKVYRRTENIFNGSFEQGYYAFANGQRDSTSVIAQKWVCTTLVACNGNSEYSIRAELSNRLMSRSYGVVWFDSSQNFISSNDFNTLANPVIFDVISPPSAEFFSINIAGTTTDTVVRPSDINNATIVNGSTAPAQYIPYLQPTNPPVALPALPTCDGTTIVDYAGRARRCRVGFTLSIRKEAIAHEYAYKIPCWYTRC